MIKPTNSRTYHYIPTPQEIAAVCEEIQAEWSDDEERSRNKRRPKNVDVRICRVREVEMPEC